MENETGTQEVVTTPVETSDVETSENVTPAEADTVTTEPTDEEVTAETTTETETEQEKLYANKYKSVDDLEKGYLEAQKIVSKSNEFEKKYNELLAEKENAQAEKTRQELLQAQQRGFDSKEEAEIADKVTLAEFNYYWANQNRVQPECAQQVNNLLQQYYASGNKAYLEQAKTYFTSDFIESVAVQKSDYANQLRQELAQQRKETLNKSQAELANKIQANFPEFLGDIKENEGKAQALKTFCNANFINNLDDMKAFELIYSKIAKYEREQAIKEFEAQKTIDETKEKAQVNTGVIAEIQTKTPPSYAEIASMSQEQYNAAVDKWGLQKILAAK